MAWQRKRKERSLQGKLVHARKLLNADPNNINLQSVIAATENELRKMDNYKGQGAKIRSWLHWIKEGNKGTRYFFNYLNYKHKKEKIGAIKDNFGSFLTDPAEICKAFKYFYEHLFKDDQWPDIQEVLEDIVKVHIPQRIAADYNRYLDRLLTLEEMENGLFNMAPYKCPGSDGLPMEFYKAMWKHIKEDFYY